MFGVGKPTYVGWFEKKWEREIKMKYQPLDERFVFVKYLKKDINDQQLEGAFSKYGEVGSIRIGAPKTVLKPYTTNFATVLFKNVDDAKKCVMDFKTKNGTIKEAEEIKSLFDGNGFVCTLRPK